MSNDHDEVWSEEGMEADEKESDFNAPVSSDGGAAGETAESSGDLVEDGHDVMTHGGGELESVPGFEEKYAMSEGFPAEYVPLEEELRHIGPCCGETFEKPESVCGRDDRVRIRSTTRIPWRLCCQLVITRRDGARSRCTGWFIGPRTVMTAGHCVFSHGAGGWARKIEVIPGMDSSFRPFGSQSSSSFRSVKGWTRDRKTASDYGAIILPSDTLGKRVGWLGFAALSTASLRNLLVNNAGYAGDKPFGTLWYNAGRITRVTGDRLYYMLDTFGGHSGSPLWRTRSGKRHAVGIHNYGGCPNKSTRITRAVFNNMKSWKNV